jgi:hypothetical protein
MRTCLRDCLKRELEERQACRHCRYYGCSRKCLNSDTSYPVKKPGRCCIYPSTETQFNSIFVVIEGSRCVVVLVLIIPAT